MRQEVTIGRMKENVSKARKWINVYLFLIIFIFFINLFLAFWTVYIKQTSNLNNDIQSIPLSSIVKIQKEDNVGSGFIVGTKQLLSVAHVVGDVGSVISIFLKDGKEYQGSVVASGFQELQGTNASVNDWALIEITEEFDPSYIIPIGESSSLSVGAEVWIIGYPGGGSQNTSGGIISGVTPDELHTDAGVDPGYSGGPLVSISEKAVVGIVVSTPIISGERSNSVANALRIESITKSCKASGHSIMQ